VAITGVPLTAVGGGFSFSAPAGAADLRYVIKAVAVPDNSGLLFTNKDHPEVTFTVPVPSGQTGYYYGGILVNPGEALTLAMTGPASYDTSSLLIYEAPK